TIDDYWSFVSMLLPRGAPQGAGSAKGGRRGRGILSPGTVELMTADRLTASQRRASRLFLGRHGGWGLGMAVPATGSSDKPPPCGFGVVRRQRPDVGLHAHH